MYRNKEDQRRYHREWSKKKKPHLKKLYGISLEEYNYMFSEQEGRCLGCRKHQSELRTSLHVDHNHTTGKIRGLLCRKCNSAIGLISDNINVLKTMIKYLQYDK